jgi:hypothetical protein
VAGLQTGEGQAPHVPAARQTGQAQPPHSSPPPQPAPPPHAPLPPTGAEFAQHLLAGRNLSRAQSRETGRAQAPQPVPSPQPAGPPSNRHSEQSEEPAFSELRPALSRTAPTPQPALYGRGDP